MRIRIVRAVWGVSIWLALLGIMGVNAVAGDGPVPWEPGTSRPAQ